MVSDSITLREEAFSYAPVSRFCAERCITADALDEAGVLWHPGRQALAYPRINREGELLGYKYRSLVTNQVWADEGTSGSYALITARRGAPAVVVLCEGETDALCLSSNLWVLGAAQHACIILACPGATAFQPWWAEGWIGKDVIVIPDGDEAGRRMARKVASTIPYARIARLLEGADLCDYFKTGKSFGLEVAIQRAAPLELEEIPSRSLRSTKHDPIPDHILQGSLLFEAERLTTLRRRGSEYAGRCPFHEERTPSFMVNPGKGVWHCHGCNRGGTLIDLVMFRDDCDFPTAVTTLKHAHSLD